MIHRCANCQWNGEGERCTNVASFLYSQIIGGHIGCPEFQSHSKCRQCAHSAYNSIDRAWFCFRQDNKHEGKVVTSLTEQPCFEKRINLPMEEAINA